MSAHVHFNTGKGKKESKEKDTASVKDANIKVGNFTLFIHTCLSNISSPFFLLFFVGFFVKEHALKPRKKHYLL